MRTEPASIQVLITRPLEPAQRLAGRLQDQGMSSIVMPMYTFAAMQPSADVARAWEDEKKRKLAVFTSPRAVRYGFEHIPPGLLDTVEFAAIGDATRARLEARGVRVHVQAAGGFTSEDLLQTPELVSNPGLAIIFCAPGGREALVSGLDQLNWSTLKAMVYERVALAPSAAHIEAIETADGLVSTWTSVSALELAREGLPAGTWNKILCNPALVISQRIKDHLQRAGARRVELARGPGNEALTKSIQHLAGKLMQYTG